ncbi:MAG: tRNA (adenosine(37)-N6)-threonylcarbamoyltransferase complex ATPase subunit type 1 TsaE [Schwartzia sp.]|nr:tRNA (adenosine(37)-N6)-threonylcarbamoyltransferase complex ATPase subunit type 1 TsaE [Schwartzia sp. (in: firmicutes)]
MEIITKAPEETSALACRIGKNVPAGTVICLTGDLGAGKTLFTEGFCRGLGIDSDVTSPTFNLMNVYEGRLLVRHFDLYRLEEESELEEFGFYEYSEPDDGLVLIEWADKFPEALPEAYIRIHIERGQDENERVLSFTRAGEIDAAWLRELLSQEGK